MSLAARPARTFTIRLSIAVAAVALLAPCPAAAQSDPDQLVAQARQAMLRLSYDRAIRLLERAEEAGRSDRDQLVLIYRSLAESRAALGEGEAAETEFRRLLALDPAAELPSGSSPKLTAPFESAREFMRQRPPLTVACLRDGRSAVLAIQSDPLALVAAARLTTAHGDVLTRGRRRSGRTRVPLYAPAGAPQELACAAVDRHGNELARAAIGSAADRRGQDPGATLDPTTILTPTDQARTVARRSSRAAPASDTGTRSASTVTVARTPAPESPPIYTRWWLWGTGALVAAGTSAFFAVQLQADEDDWRAIKRASQDHRYAQALEVQERGERHALYANIATMTTAALAAVSLGLLVRDLVRDGDESAAQVGAAPLPGGGGAATFRVSF